MSETHFRKLEKMYLSAPINRFFQPEIRIDDGRAEVRIPIRAELFHAAGAAHGAVYFKAADDAAFFAANSLVEDAFVLTTSMNLYLLRPIADGTLTSRARVVHEARSGFVAEAILTDGRERQVGRATGTFVRGRTPLTEDIGYRL
ncbi:MAG TPA: PaaI family thioesterase [Anaeromyxobacteraceae bacterium]|nr:PaaI family thioesterase [Anaeromyxobacteraceae bacterium]